MCTKRYLLDSACVNKVLKMWARLISGLALRVNPLELPEVFADAANRTWPTTVRLSNFNFRERRSRLSAWLTIRQRRPHDLQRRQSLTGGPDSVSHSGNTVVAANRCLNKRPSCTASSAIPPEFGKSSLITRSKLPSAPRPSLLAFARERLRVPAGMRRWLVFYVKEHDSSNRSQKTHPHCVEATHARTVIDF